MRKLFYIFVFFIPFVLVSQQHPGGGGGGGGRGGEGGHGGGARGGGSRGGEMSKDVEERAIAPRPKEVPQAIEKEMEASRVPSFNRREMEGQPQAVRANEREMRNAQIPQAVKEKQNALHPTPAKNPTAATAAPSKQVPEKVTQFLAKAKGIAKPAQKPAPAITSPHAAPRIQVIQRNLGVNHPQMNNWFNQSFYQQHQFYPPYFRQNGFYWWNRPNWLLVNSFLGWGWGYPYDYGSNGPVIVTSPPVYNTTQYYTTIQQSPAAEVPSTVPEAPEQPEQTSAPASTRPAWTPEQQLGQQAPAQGGDWLSLGVFAAGRSAGDVQYGQQFIQLAVDKEGTLSGTYYNASTDQVHPLGGTIDKESQLAAWTVTDDPDSPVMTTGIYNLTEDEVPVQVHFSNGVQQSWVLIRLSEQK